MADRPASVFAIRLARAVPASVHCTDIHSRSDSSKSVAALKYPPRRSQLSLVHASPAAKFVHGRFPAPSSWPFRSWPQSRNSMAWYPVATLAPTPSASCRVSANSLGVIAVALICVPDKENSGFATILRPTIFFHQLGRRMTQKHNQSNLHPKAKRSPCLPNHRRWDCQNDTLPFVGKGYAPPTKPLWRLQCLG